MWRSFKILFIGIGLACFAGFFDVPQTLGADFDFYVDKSADEDGDGSKDAPFRTIGEAVEKALDESKSKRKISLKKGMYEESVTLDEGMELEGAGRGSTVIAGTVVIRDNAVLRKLTINTSALTAVTIEGKADVEISDVEIKGFLKMGINALAGSGEIIVKKSAIHGSKGKGLYIQKGHRVEITDNKIYDNAEEGLDLRNNIDGIIKNNAIYENGEGGMEIIVGDSDVVISGNKFTKNKASGIATQFYETAEKDGRIQISDNEITNNGKYGIDCNVPSGGSPSAGYWARSLDLRDNQIEKNKREEINKFCKIIEAVDPNEESDNTIKESVPEVPIEASEETDKSPEVDVTTLSEEDLARERAVWDQVERHSREDEAGEAKTGDLRKKIVERSSIRTFLFGPDRASLAIIREEARLARERINNLKVLLEQAKNVQSDTGIQNFIAAEEAEITEWENFIKDHEDRFSLFGWLFRM